MREWKYVWIGESWFAEQGKLDISHKESVALDAPEHTEQYINHHMLARKQFELEEVPDHAQLFISADDYYKLYVNGQYVGQGPAQSSPNHYYYNVYDIDRYLQAGSNVIAVHVYYHGLITRAYSSADYRQGVMIELELNGNLLLGTDRTWKIKRAEEYRAKDTVGYNTQFYEHIDNRLKEPEWRSVTYRDVAWKQASIVQHPDYQLVEQLTPPVAQYIIQPVQVVKQANGYFVDFGHELTGAVTMIAKGKAGQMIEIRCGEELDDNGTVRQDMRCSCTYRDIWTLSGEEDTLEWFDYKGFRYVEIIVSSNTVDMESIAAVARHYPIPDHAVALKSENKLLEEIWSICRDGVIYGTQDYYTDCPTREKGGYLGDNTVTAPAHFYITGDVRLYRKTLKDFALTSRICPGLMAVTPGSYMQEIADYSLQWPMQVLQYYRYSGDLEFIHEMLPYAIGLVTYFQKYIGADALLHNVKDKWNLVDWPLGMRDGYDFQLTRPPADGCHNVINAFYYNALLSVNEMLVIAGKGERYDTDAFAEAFQDVLWNQELLLFVDAVGSDHASLHANMLPMMFGLVPDKGRINVAKYLVDKRMNCGVYMSYFYLKALSAAGEYDAVWRTIMSEEPHKFITSDHERNIGSYVTQGYWANMVREGATTCFESWSKHLKWNTSLCHPWASAPIPILIEDILGIRPGEPGWKTISCTPRIPKDMPDLELIIPLPGRNLHVQVKDGKLDLQEFFNI